MDYEYYAILGVIVLVMLIAAFSFVNNVSSWGPDLTDELPAYLIAESLSRFNKKTDTEKENMISVPSKPNTRPTAPLLKYYRGTSSVVVV